MGQKTYIVAGVLLLTQLAVWQTSPFAAEPASTSPAQVERLVEQLGSQQFEEGEAASRALEKIGYPALDALKKAAQSEDRETRRRATEDG